MKSNIGTPDRLIRLVIAILFLAAAWWESSWILFVISLFVFYEALVGWCALYQILGKNSCPIDTNKKT
jgi:hypothetical protein